MTNPYALNGKTILVTGASSGLGASVAAECSRLGATLIITARNEERLNQTFQELVGEGHTKIVADLTQAQDIELLIEQLPIVDGMALCAGITKTLPVKFINDQAVEEIFQTNTFSSIKLIQQLLKKKKVAKKGSVVFISSISTAYADKGNAIYAASKGALNSFSKVLALESAAQGIRSNCIQPGFVPSRMLEAGVVTQEQLQEELKKYPLGFGEPTDIAYGVAYLLSDAAKWITGSVLTIDGGVTLR